MKSAGKSLLLAVSLLLAAATKTHAQDLDNLNLVTAKQPANICESPLKPYVLLHSINCPAVEARQVQFSGNVKSEKPEEFSVSHSISAANYTPTPSPKKASPTPSVIVAEVKIAEPTPTVIVSEQTVTHVGNNPDVVMNLVNAHRATLGKPAFIKDDALCSLAQTRSNELAGEGANGTLHAGLYSRNLGYWATENAKIGGDEAETVRWWLNSSIHRSQIQSDYVNACVGCTGKNCALVFTNYTPKGTLASNKEE